MNDDRPSPEKFLEDIRREEDTLSKGKLKIFLGMAAGVGKTYAMLEEAQRLTKEGVNLAVGIADAHGRKETQNLLTGLHIIPEKIIAYKGRQFHELDLEAVLAARPKIVLIDELAHNNVPGLRHEKRWQDVLEILDNGIDVYTTLNVQHIDSLNDIVKGITDVSVRETVPDLVVEQASSIQLVDLTPEGLLQRLKEGKVYVGEQSRIAIQNFFQKDRITALRELVLRYTAKKVDHDLIGMRPKVEAGYGWKTNEKLLVAVSPNPFSQKLIRTTRRLAFNQNAEWIALYVNTGKLLSEHENASLVKNLALANELGAEVITVNDPDVIKGIQFVANQNGVTQIIAGRPIKKPFLGLFQRKPMVDLLADKTPNIDIHVVRDETSWEPVMGSKAYIPRRKTPSKMPYFYALIIVLSITLLSFYLSEHVSHYIIAAFYFVGILVFSLLFQMRHILFGAALSILLWDFFFVFPPWKFNFDTIEELAAIVLVMMTALVTGILINRERESKEVLALREESSRTMYEVVKYIATAPTLADLLKGIKSQLKNVIDGDFDIVLRSNGSVFLDSPLLRDPNEQRVCEWAFKNSSEAGWSTSSISSAKNLYIPLKGFKEIVGVLIYKPWPKGTLVPKDRNLLYNVAKLLGDYLERSKETF